MCITDSDLNCLWLKLWSQGVILRQNTQLYLCWFSINCHFPPTAGCSYSVTHVKQIPCNLHTPFRSYSYIYTTYLLRTKQKRKPHQDAGDYHTFLSQHLSLFNIVFFLFYSADSWQQGAARCYKWICGCSNWEILSDLVSLIISWGILAN